MTLNLDRAIHNLCRDSIIIIANMATFISLSGTSASGMVDEEKEFTALDTSELLEYMRVYRSHYVKDAAQHMKNKAFAIPAHYVHAKSNSLLPDDKQERSRWIITPIQEKMYDYGGAIGFGIVQIDEQNERASVVEIGWRITIKVRSTVRGERTWRVYERIKGEDILMPNIIVFEFEPLVEMGGVSTSRYEIQSVTKRVLPMVQLLEFLQRQYVLATTEAAKRVLILDPEGEDPARRLDGAASLGMDGTSLLQGNGSLAQEARNSGYTQERQPAWSDWVEALQHREMQRSTAKIQQMHALAEQAQRRGQNTDVRQLPDGTKLANASQPVGPDATLMDMIHTTNNRINEAFGYPYQLINDQAAGKGSSGGGDIVIESGHNQNEAAKQLEINADRIRQRLANIATVVYNAMTRKSRIIEFVANVVADSERDAKKEGSKRKRDNRKASGPLREENGTGQFRRPRHYDRRPGDMSPEEMMQEETAIKVVMHNMISTNEAIQIYACGMLKAESLLQICSNDKHLPRDWFEDTIVPKQIAYEAPKETTASSSSSSTKKKSKTK
jgi:hypothetical protein